MRLEEIKKQIENCKKCDLWKYRTKAVAGEGPSNAKLFFVGEAPGRLEDLSGKPFIGPAGKFLEKMINYLGFERKDVFLTGIVKCRPPKNRRPTKKEIEACKEYTIKQIEAINPKIVVILGNAALEGLIGSAKVTKFHGKLLEKDGRKFFITFHPSAARRFPKIRELMWKDMKKLKKILIKEKI